MTDAERSRPSRSQRTREATAVNALGLRLIALPAAELDRLELPEELRDAIDLCQRLKPRAQARQKRLVGQLLRAEDHAAIGARFEKLASHHHEGIADEKTSLHWRSRLIEEDGVALQDFLDAHPNADPGELAALAELVERATRASNIARTKHARRELLRAIRKLRS